MNVLMIIKLLLKFKCRGGQNNWFNKTIYGLYMYTYHGMAALMK